MEQTLDQSLVDFDQIQAVISECGWQVSASELHGYQAGLISLGLYGTDQYSHESWLEHFSIDYPFSDAKPLNIQDQELLNTLWLYCLQGLESDSFEFDLLLPDDDASLILRVSSLSEWCSGYLSGIQKALTLVDADVRNRIQESAQIKELLLDLSAVRQAHNLELNDVDDLLETERNYAEISEYVRVAAMNIYMDIVLGMLDDSEAAAKS